MRKIVLLLCVTLLAALAGALLGCSKPPPAPPDEPCQPVPDAPASIVWKNATDVELTWEDMPVVVGGGDEACVLSRRLEFTMHEPRTVKAVHSFHGFDNGDAVESLTALYAKDGKNLYARSEHLEAANPDCYDAIDTPWLMNYKTEGLILDAVCRTTGNNGQTGAPSSRCHLVVYVEFEEGGTPPVPSQCSKIPHPNVPATPKEETAVKKPKVKDAIKAVDAECGGTCETWLITLGKLAEWLNAHGECAYGPWVDALAVLVSEDPLIVEEYHPVSSGNTWTDNKQGKYLATWYYEEQPPGECGVPDPLGLPGEIVLKHFNQWWDSTYKVTDYDYCWSIGINQGACPVRPEGHPQRKACELRVIGTQKWWCDGTPITKPCSIAGAPCLSDTNPAQAKCKSHVKTCTESGATCAEADW